MLLDGAAAYTATPGSSPVSLPIYVTGNTERVDGNHEKLQGKAPHAPNPQDEDKREKKERTL